MKWTKGWVQAATAGERDDRGFPRLSRGTLTAPSAWRFDEVHESDMRGVGGSGLRWVDVLGLVVVDIGLDVVCLACLSRWRVNQNHLTLLPHKQCQGRTRRSCPVLLQFKLSLSGFFLFLGKQCNVAAWGIGFPGTKCSASRFLAPRSPALHMALRPSMSPSIQPNYPCDTCDRP